MKKAIFLYSLTDYMAKPWLDAGYECYLFDGQHKQGVTKDGNLVKVGYWFDAYDTRKDLRNIIEIVGQGVCFVAGFPECTDLAVSGACRFKSKAAKNPAFQAEATELARLVSYVGDYYNCPWFAENPVSVLATLWRKPDYRFHPWEYGAYLNEKDSHPEYPDYIAPRDCYNKLTCIWSNSLFTMPAKRPVSAPSGYSSQYSKLGGRSLKTKNIRSATPRGFALACYQANAPQCP